MNNTVLLVLAVVVVLYVVGKDKKPASTAVAAVPAAKPDGSQNEAPDNTFRDVVGAISLGFEAATAYFNNTDTTTQRN